MAVDEDVRKKHRLLLRLLLSDNYVSGLTVEDTPARMLVLVTFLEGRDRPWNPELHALNEVFSVAPPPNAWERLKSVE